MWYTQSVLCLSSSLSFGCTSICLRFLCGLTADVISWCFSLHCNGSVTPLKYDSVTIHLDFSLFFSLDFLCWFCCFSLIFIIVYLWYPHSWRALVMYSSSFRLSSGSGTMLLHLSNSVFMTPSFWCSGWYELKLRNWYRYSSRHLASSDHWTFISWRRPPMVVET